jgi:hypothetical protein
MGSEKYSFSPPVILRASTVHGSALINIEKPLKKSKEYCNICPLDTRSLLVQGKKICYLIPTEVSYREVPLYGNI